MTVKGTTEWRTVVRNIYSNKEIYIFPIRNPYGNTINQCYSLVSNFNLISLFLFSFVLLRTSLSRSHQSVSLIQYSVFSIEFYIEISEHKMFSMLWLYLYLILCIELCIRHIFVMYYVYFSRIVGILLRSGAISFI